MKTAPHDYHSSHKSRPQRPWWGATNHDVLATPCRRAVDINKIHQELEKAALQERSDTLQIHGSYFSQGSTETLQAFKDLLTQYAYPGVEVKESEQINIQNTYSINPQCEDALCASKLIFGEERGPLILYLRYRYGMNASHLVTQNAAKINRRELLSFLRAMGDFPGHLFPLENNKQMIRFKRGYTLRIYDERTLANASMAFFDGWENLGLEGQTGRKDYVVTHELAHVLGESLQLHERQEWLDLSGWRETEDGPQHEGEHHFISGYSMTNPKEDFAETLAAYRYSPQALQAIVPQKYRFMKKYVFGGVEYLKQQHCAVPKNSPLYSQLETVLNQTQSFTLKKLKALTLEASPFYGEDLGSYLSGKQSKSKFLKALQSGLGPQVFIQQNPSLNKLEKYTRAKHINLALMNTDFSLLNKWESLKIYEAAVEKIKELMAKALYKRNYLYYTRDAQNEEELIKGCRDYSQFGIYSQSLKNFLGGHSSISKLKDFSRELMFDFCRKTIQKLGVASRPGLDETTNYINKRLVEY